MESPNVISVGGTGPKTLRENPFLWLEELRKKGAAVGSVG